MNGVVGVGRSAPKAEAHLTPVPFVPVGERRWLQRIEGASLIGLLVISIPTAPTKAFCFQSIGSLRTLQPEQGLRPRSRFDLVKLRGFNDLRRRGAVCEAPSRPGIPTASTSFAWIETQDRPESVFDRSPRGAG